MQSNDTYSDSGNFSTALGGNQDIAPAGSPVVSNLAETLSLTTFDAAGLETTLETDNPGMDYAVVVLSSDYSASLNASASTQVFNFDAAFAAHDYSGTTSTSNFQISGAASTGTAADALVNTAFNVPAFGIGNFEDGDSGATSATVSLSDMGVAPTDGSLLDFNYSGTAVLALFSDDPLAANQFGVMTATAFGSASLSTDYAVYKLTLIPEPSSTLYLLSLLGLIALRRRR